MAEPKTKPTDVPVADFIAAVENPRRRADAEAMQALKAMFGNAIPQPVGAQITRWAQDPFAYGSYSFNAVGSTNRDRQILARNLGGLYWAGEATHSEYPGTVHGAYLSGIRAAKQLLLLLRPSPSHGIP